ncbi:MAG TPA: 30S ribosomal protein S6 [Actinomycetota bacterium]
MRKYELMLILPAESDESVVTRVVERINTTLADGKGQVGKLDRWGRRRLAYEIAHQAEGYYLVAELEAEPAALTELDRVLHLADEVIRFKVVQRVA